jgi:hypothetical protein
MITGSSSVESVRAATYLHGDAALLEVANDEHALALEDKEPLLGLLRGYLQAGSPG